MYLKTELLVKISDIGNRIQLTSEYGTSSVFRQLPPVPCLDAVCEMERPKSELLFLSSITKLDRFIYKEKKVYI